MTNHCLPMEPQEQRQAHLSAEVIVELAARGRRCPRYEELIEHMIECPICRETYKQLLAAEATVRAYRRPVRLSRVTLWMPLTAAAVLLLLFGARALLTTGANSYELHQVNGVWYEGATRLPEWAFAAAVQFEHPPAPTRYTPQAEPNPPRLTIPNPANHALETLTPEFQWTPVPDAVRYRAVLESIDGSQRVDLTVEGNRATLPAKVALRAGETYRLTLEAIAENDLPGDGWKSVYEFRALTPQEQTHLRWARANRQLAPRACAMIFYQLGVYDEAMKTLQLLPDSPLAQRWRERIQQQMSGL